MTTTPRCSKRHRDCHVLWTNPLTMAKRLGSHRCCNTDGGECPVLIRQVADRLDPAEHRVQCPIPVRHRKQAKGLAHGACKAE